MWILCIYGITIDFLLLFCLTLIWLLDQLEGRWRAEISSSPTQVKATRIQLNTHRNSQNQKFQYHQVFVKMGSNQNTRTLLLEVYNHAITFYKVKQMSPRNQQFYSLVFTQDMITMLTETIFRVISLITAPNKKLCNIHQQKNEWTNCGIFI